MVIAVETHKIAYMALPKAGCTSVKEALARLDPDIEVPPSDEITEFTWHQLCRTRRFRKKRWKLYQSYWRFCVIRDPVKRLLSVYTDLVTGRQDLLKERTVRLSDKLTTEPDPDFFFTNLDAYRQESSNVQHHAFPSHIFLGPDLGVYHRVYRTNELAFLGEALSAISRQSVVVPHRNASKQRLSLDDLKPQTIDAIRPYLEQEYALVSKYYDNPLGGRLYKACTIPSPAVS